MRFLVKVSCCGPQWLVYVPAFGVTRIVQEKNRIRAEASEMIIQCGAAPDEFEIDLVLGRVIEPR